MDFRTAFSKNLLNIFLTVRPKSQIDELQAGVEQTLVVFPKPAAFFNF